MPSEPTPLYTKDTDLLKISKAEVTGLRFLADGINLIHFHHRKRIRKRYGRPYRLTINFSYTKNGEMEIVDLTLREISH